MSDTQQPMLDRATHQFIQEQDTCRNKGDGYDVLRVEYVGLAGDGGFWRIKTACWAIDSLEELVDTLKRAGVKE